MRFSSRVTAITLVTLPYLLTGCGNGEPSDTGVQELNASAGISPGESGNSPSLGSALPDSSTPVTTVAATEDLAVPDSFDWSSNGELKLSLQLVQLDGSPAVRTGVSVYAMPDTALADGAREPFERELEGVATVFQGITDDHGRVDAELHLPSHVVAAGHLYVRTKLIGVPATAVVAIEADSNGMTTANWRFEAPESGPETVDGIDPFDLTVPDTADANLQSRNATKGRYLLEPWNSYYHWYYGHLPGVWRGGNCDVTTATFGQLCRSDVGEEEVKRLAEILQEGTPPSEKYLSADASQSNLTFSKPARVVITFLQESAGYRNTFGLFTYDSATPPTDHLALETTRVVFPNTSFYRSGGAMFAGDSVSLGEIDPASGDDTLGFYIAANAWWNNRGQANEDGVFYSLEHLNPESDPELRKHMLLIANELDETRNVRRLWVAAEDIRLDDPASDHDYNDLIIQLDVYPADAIAFGDNIPDITDVDNTRKDLDNDGVFASDDIDDNDPARAFERYYPGENTWGTLLAEDNWPALGDFDMNDMVVRYRSREVLDSSNRIKDVEINYELVARGGAFHSGFAVSLGSQVFADNVSSATLNGEQVQPRIDNTALVYEIFSDAWSHTFEGGVTCWTYNTLSECDHLPASGFDLNITFATAVDDAHLAPSPYNPFLVAHKIAGDHPGYTRSNAFNSELYSENGVVHDIEIHLPHQQPTQGQDVSLFGTGEDGSNGVDRFYVSTDNLPWIIDIPDTVHYPEEFSDISDAYPGFASWVTSAGTSHLDWYRHPAEDESLIYQERKPADIDDEPLLASAREEE